MNRQSSFGGFNFGENAVWRIYDGYTTPMLKAFLTPLAGERQRRGQQGL